MMILFSLSHYNKSLIKIKVFRISLFFYLLFTLPLHAKPLHIAATADTMPTFTKKDGKYLGIYADIMQALCKELGKEYVISLVPRKRLEQLVQTNEFQIGGIMDKGWVKAENFLWSIPLYSMNTILLTKRARKFQFHTMEDLQGRYVGCQLGYVYGKTLMDKFAKGEMKRDDAPYLYQNLKRLEYNFIDAIVLTQMDADYLFQKKSMNKVIFAVQPMIESSYTLSLMCSKEIDIPIEKINKAILKLQQNNTLKNIFKKYGAHL